MVDVAAEVIPILVLCPVGHGERVSDLVLNSNRCMMSVSLDNQWGVVYKNPSELSMEWAIPNERVKPANESE